jgi:hypothetical protein
MQEVRGNMSHVDDGTLHAYLDGELTPVERARLEAHVAECGACRDRLAEERALIERASSLLGLAQPPERAAPPLHQLRRPSVVWRLRVPVAWAATVVLAVGLGYYAGDRTSDRTSMSAAPEPVAMRAADSSVVDRAGYVGTSPSRLYTPPRAQSPAPPRTRPLAAAERKEAERQPVMVVDGTPVASRLDTAPFGAAAANGVVAIRSRDTGAANAAPVAAPAPPAAPQTAGAALPQSALEEVRVTTGTAIVQRDDVRRALVATQWPIIRRGPARQILGAEPMGVPGLAVRNIRRSPTGEVVLVEQAIDSVTVIQLFQERVESDHFLARSFAADSLRSDTPVGYVSIRGGAATERLARFIGGVRVEIAGPLSADSLNRLLEQVKPIGP